MTTVKVSNKTLTILSKNCLKLLHTNGSRVTYWRLPTYFQWKVFLLQNLKAMKVSKLSITKLQKGPQFWWLFSLWWFTQFGVLLSPIALKVIFPCFLTQILQGMTPILLSNSLYGNSQNCNFESRCPTLCSALSTLKKNITPFLSQQNKKVLFFK